MSRIEDFTSHQREENDNDDLGLSEEIKTFEIVKENVSAIK